MTTLEMESQGHEDRSRLADLLDSNREGLLTCIHCGLCLPACPTYLVTGDENESPRGRIYLMRALVEERIGMSESFASHIDLCLGCRACETACPSAVPYGQLLEASRVGVASAREEARFLPALITRFVLNQVFTRPALLRFAMSMTRWFRDSGLADLAFNSHLFSGRLHMALALLLASRSRYGHAKTTTRAAGPTRRSETQPDAVAGNAASSNVGKEPLRVATLTGCVMEGLFAQANRSTRRVLEHRGCSVIDARDQVCCGALHAHSGQLEIAKSLARKNIDAFERTACSRIIVNAAGCGAAMKEYGHLLAGDAEYLDRANRFSSSVRDVTEFLSEIGVAPPPLTFSDPKDYRSHKSASRIGKRALAPPSATGLLVAYDAPCHLTHAQRVRAEPIAVLQSIPGIEMVPLRDSESCCGGAGIYNLLNPELSAQILSEKIDNIVASGADTVATGNPGCIMQIGAGLLMRGLETEVVHPIELIDAAYSAATE
jgi:glycolate oxidase iron-sulfur subunit